MARECTSLPEWVAHSVENAWAEVSSKENGADPPEGKEIVSPWNQVDMLPVPGSMPEPLGNSSIQYQSWAASKLAGLADRRFSFSDSDRWNGVYPFLPAPAPPKGSFSLNKSAALIKAH